MLSAELKDRIRGISRTTGMAHRRSRDEQPGSSDRNWWSRIAWVGTLLALLLSLLPASAAHAQADSGPVTVSLTFDDNFLSQYALGYLDALEPNNVQATFFVNSGIIGGSSSKLTWDDLSAMASQGNEIGGKTVDGTNLTTVDPATATTEVCNDRQALIAHGFSDPISFAYPYSDRNQEIESIVAGCGYGGARIGGGLSPSGPRYSGPIPPSDNYYEIRAWDQGDQITLPDLESIVTDASENPGQGGWVPIVIQQVCDQTLDPSDYASCQSGSWIELSDLNAFLTWVRDAGETGGAPAGTTIKTMGAVLTASDTTPPVTTIACNGATCVDTPYMGGSVTVTMSATDMGSGVASTHYTLDGSTPTLSSPIYTGPFVLTTGTTTVSFRSWDNVGNVEATNTQTIQVEAAPDTIPPTTAILCGGVACTTTNYMGGVTVSLIATDNAGGPGVAATYYTTDDTDPTTSPTRVTYEAPFMVAGNTTIEFYSVDNAGNAEAVQTQQLYVTPYPVVVSLTFDDAYENQWLYLEPLLQEYKMRATFYVITSDADAGYSGTMSWNQLDTLASEGNDVGGHGVNHLDLTDPTLTYAQKVADVCGSYTDLVNNGISSPESYAYPFGDYDATAESIVQSCGFKSSRITGGISSSVTTPTPPWAETIPPQDPYALRAIDVDGNTLKSLSDLENFVTAAAVNGGGWLPMIFHQVCDQNASDWSTCITQYPVQDTVLAQFMKWLDDAGQTGGAPAATTVKTVSQAIDGPETAPTGLSATPGNTTVALTWNAPSSTGGSAITGYNVYEGTSSGGESTTPVNGTTLISGTTYTVTSLTNGTKYYFTVKAVNAAGSSAASNQASATPVTVADPPPGPRHHHRHHHGRLHLERTFVHRRLGHHRLRRL